MNLPLDALLLVLTLVASGALVWVSMNNRGRKRMLWGIIGFFGIGICFLCALVLSVDGNVTWIGTTLAAANGNFISDFNVVAWTPIAIGLGETYAVILHTFRI